MVGLSHMGRKSSSALPHTGDRNLVAEISASPHRQSTTIFTQRNADSAARHSRNQSSELNGHKSTRNRKNKPGYLRALRNLRLQIRLGRLSVPEC